YLETVAASPHGVGYKELCVELLELAEGQGVVDLGCGPGLDLPRLVRAVGTSGGVVGVDLDEGALLAARRSAPSARLIHADVARVVGLSDGSVDRVKTDRVLQHVSDPSAVVAEVVRLLRRGGRVVFCEPDWDTLVLDIDPAVSRRYRDFVTATVIHNPVVGRELPRLSRAAGLHVEAVSAYTSVMTEASEVRGILGLSRVAERAVEAGALTADEAAIVAGVEASDHCLAAVSLVLTVATKP
ncbi:MAG TPA: methyltransferase domain-containing protein, partial [Propionibacteriaceae bacterium]|nr:methyltransferase domain-containing protein [Propionibacteriaceae bacterium]